MFPRSMLYFLVFSAALAASTSSYRNYGLKQLLPIIGRPLPNFPPEVKALIPVDIHEHLRCKRDGARNVTVTFEVKGQLHEAKGHSHACLLILVHNTVKKVDILSDDAYKFIDQVIRPTLKEFLDRRSPFLLLTETFRFLIVEYKSLSDNIKKELESLYPELRKTFEVVHDA
ncbi:hypothetical protein QR680_013972 [Steinernema hermaphroditum]|uniref:Uncharacterized protein n=1 Tax=Steinernema hermaphroditum TaxID=289476 RepID=A0AA39M3F1_9BILA|nr:hypothetical protein QR680_013972 [Steinernema hermaphroditum]